MINRYILEKAKKLYLKKYGVSLTDEMATKLITDLMNLMKVLLNQINNIKVIKVAKAGTLG